MATRPDLTVIFLTYQQAHLVGGAVRSVLAQTGVVAEIIFSDDASTDGTFAALQAAVAGYTVPHQVRVRRNERNQGIDHIVQLVEQATADVMVMAHGDDLSEPHRCRRLLEELDASGAAAACSNFLEIDGSGHPMGLNLAAGATRTITAEEIASTGWQPPFYGATLAWRRDVYRRFPRLDKTYLSFGHDTVVPFRGALLGGMRYIHEPLLRYRRHAGQWSRVMKERRTPEMSREAQIAAETMTQVAMSRDVSHWRADPLTPPDERWDRLQALVDNRLQHLAAAWVLQRQRMYALGLRPTWIEQAPFEQAGRRRTLRDVRLALRGWLRRLRWELLHQ